LFEPYGLTFSRFEEVGGRPPQQVAYDHFHVGVIGQIGGFGEDNNAQSAYQVDVGGEYAGLSLDAVYAYAEDAVTLSNYTSGAPTPDTLKATLANLSAGVIAGKFTWHALTVLGGYEFAQLTSPTNLFGATATSTGQTLVLGGGYPAVVQANAYVQPKNQQVFWIGEKYKILSNLDFDAGYYYVQQGIFTNAATKYNVGNGKSSLGIGCGPNLNAAIPGSTPQGSNSSSCAGSEDALSAEFDWRVVKRVDLYAGLMYSEVQGGLANGYIVNNNTAFTTGLRFAF